MSTEKNMTVTDRLRARVSPATKRYVAKNLAIAEQVRALMRAKGITQLELAKLMGKQPSEVSRLLSGLHNLTLESITRMEDALGADIILTPLTVQEQQGQVTYASVYADNNQRYQRRSGGTLKPMGVPLELESELVA